MYSRFSVASWFNTIVQCPYSRAGLTHPWWTVVGTDSDKACCQNSQNKLFNSLGKVLGLYNTALGSSGHSRFFLCSYQATGASETWPVPAVQATTQILQQWNSDSTPQPNLRKKGFKVDPQRFIRQPHELPFGTILLLWVSCLWSIIVGSFLTVSSIIPQHNRHW